MRPWYSVPMVIVILLCSASKFVATGAQVLAINKQREYRIQIVAVPGLSYE